MNLESEKPSGIATTKKTMFSRETSVSILINADSAIIWALLTHAVDFPRWNSTVVSIEGNIQKEGKIKLRSTLAPKKTFQLRIREFEREKKLAWGDGQGVRVYSLTPAGNETVQFDMTEKIGGMMFPLYAKYIPPFDRSFEQFAADLKKESEAIHHLKN